MRTSLAIAFCAALSLMSCGSEAAWTVRLLGSIDGKKPQAGWVYARAGQTVTLHAELSPLSPKAAALKVKELRWFRIEPTSQALDNTTPSFHFERIEYAAEEIDACRGETTCVADVSPKRMPKVEGLDGLGAMAFQVRATLSDGSGVATPGIDSVERGGLSREVFKVAVRRDDTYLGYLTELLNTPYIFGSDGPEGRHQADLLIGSDCADLAVYAARRTGKKVPYVSTWTIADHAPEKARATSVRSDGVMVDAKNAEIRIGSGKDEIRPGDLVLFPNSRHVGVLWEDRAPVGVLDSADLMFHTCWAPPTVESLGASRCASLPVRVLRFR